MSSSSSAKVATVATVATPASSDPPLSLPALLGLRQAFSAAVIAATSRVTDESIAEVLRTEVALDQALRDLVARLESGAAAPRASGASGAPLAERVQTERLRRLARWHREQAHTARWAANTTAMDHPDVALASLASLANFHDGAAGLIEDCAGPEAEAATAAAGFQAAGLATQTPETPQSPTMADGSDSRCRRCGGAMGEGIALLTTFTAGLPDFPGRKECVTLSPGGPGRLTPCRKCGDCGWSVSGAPAAGPSQRRA